MKLLIIDNYDSFTHNLYQLCGQIMERKLSQSFQKGFELQIDVFKNDEKDLEFIKNERYDKIIISPGPGSVSDDEYFGICKNVIIELGKNTPILGICLGMQGIAYCFGGEIHRSKFKLHGKVSTIDIRKSHSSKLFYGLNTQFQAMRYHSLCVENTPAMDQNLILSATATESDGSITIMALEHRIYPIYGVQFHPESYETKAGGKIINNFLNL